MRASRFLRGVAALAACATPVIAHADGFTYGVDTGIGESDNITLVSTDKVRQTMAIVDADFSLQGKSSRLEEDVVGTFTYLDFLQHAYGSEVLGRLNGSAQYAIIPGSLNWTLQDSWGQAQVNPFGPLVPTNQENINYLSTGPDWYARLGSTTFLDLGARYARADYQTTPIDSNRLLGTLQLGRELSAQSSVSLNGSYQRILYTNTTLNTDDDLDSLYGQYAIHGARTDFTVNAGVSRYTAGAQSASGSLFGLQLARKVSPAARVTLSAGRQLTDTSAGFSNLSATSPGSAPAAGGAINTPINNTSAPLSSGVYRADYVGADWNFQRARTTIDVNARWEKDHYLYLPQYDNSKGNVNLSFERRLSRALSAQLSGNWVRNGYDNVQFVATAPAYTTDYGYVGAGLTYHEGRGLEIRLRYDHMTQSASGGAGQGYGENRIFLTIGYRPRPAL